MVLIARSTDSLPYSPLLRAMFEARKSVFVDLLKWDVPVVEGRYEMDQFDDNHAVYLVLTDDQRRHRGSVRLLPTERPHLLDSLFPELCEGDIPRGPAIMEITRFCLSRGQSARDRRLARNQLVTGIAVYALQHGIGAFTGIAEIAWLQQILAFGWRCEPLGLPRQCGGAMLGALKIVIEPDTVERLHAAGVYAPVRTAIHTSQDAA